ncbi:MAG: M48 family metalloprotease [Deltaproteobacteria bacterium]|nr:M48 family metalloprotease [Deltaproteobacteria bacterium]
MRRAARALAVLALAITTLVLRPPPAPAMGLKDEQELGARFALEARRRLPLLRAPAITAYLRRVGERIVARLDAQQFDYRFYVVREPTLNAFAVPGGYIYVHAGLLDQVPGEAELAGVLAHEIVHVHAHHVVRQEDQTALINYATILGLFLSAVHPALGAGAASVGAAAQLKYARQYEQEADHVGIGLMRDAGFDPLGMPRFLRMVLKAQQLNPSEVPPYFLSHPLTEDRITELEHLARAMPHPKPRVGGDAELAAAQATLRALVESREKVLPAYEERLRRDPQNADAQHQLGLVFLYGGQPERAEPLLARAAAGGAARARGDQGRALARLGKLAEARAAFEAHLREYPNDPPIMLELARTMIAGGELKPAAALLETALTREPELDDAEYALAECRGKSGDEREQWWHLGRAFELRGDLERAKSAYEKVRDLAAKDTPEWKQAEEAIKALDGASGVFGG